MPESIDWPRTNSPRRRRRFFLIIAVLAGIFFAGWTSLSYYLDVLWFGSLGYGDVFWKTIRLHTGIFTAFAAATCVILYGSFLALKRAHLPDLPSGQTIIVGGQPLRLPVEPVLRLIALVISLAIAIATGASMIPDWPTLALFWYAPHATGSIADPIFGRPLNFFFFTLPAWQLLAGWLLTLAVITCLLAILFIIITGGAGALAGSRRSYVPPPWRGFSITFAFLLMVLAMRVYLGRFERLFDGHTIFGGVTYTDAHVMLTGMLIVCAALILGAVIAIVNALTVPRGRWLVAAVLPAAVCYIPLLIVGWYVNSFVVKPNELVREQPYILHNIELTRQAYGLDRVLQREFPAETDVAAADPAHNQATLQNIRLWDWRALQDTLRQIQEIRTYYDFPDIDIDRYEIDGVTRQVMLATREVNVDKLPESSRNWINEKLIYTHGYGITMNPENGFTPEGLPTLILSNMPVQSTSPLHSRLWISPQLMPIERCARSASSFAMIGTCEPFANARPGDGRRLFVRTKPLRHCGHAGHSAATWCNSSAAAAGDYCAPDCSRSSGRTLHHRISRRQDSLCGYGMGHHTHFHPSTGGCGDCFQRIGIRATRVALGV